MCELVARQRRWCKYNRDVRPWYRPQGNAGATLHVPPLEITPWLVPFLQGLQIVREDLDIAQTLSHITHTCTHRRQSLSIAAIFITNLSRKNRSVIQFERFGGRQRFRAFRLVRKSRPVVCGETGKDISR